MKMHAWETASNKREPSAPGQLSLITAVPVGCNMAEGQPPGVYYNVNGRVATVVFDGDEPDASVLEVLGRRSVSCGMTVAAHP